MNDGYRLRVTIERATETRTATGAITYAWDTPIEVGKRWARMAPKGGNEVAFGSVMASSGEIEIDIKGRIAVTPKNRLVMGGRVLDIISAQGIDGRSPPEATFVRLRCREESRKVST